MSRKFRQPPPRQSAVHPLLPQAAALHQAGQTAEAAVLYRQIIAQVPRHFDATHLLGVTALQEGRLDEAQSLIESALEISPHNAPALSNLGIVHLRKGQLHVALEYFERAVRSQPDYIDALANLGSVLRCLDRSREAISPLRRAYGANRNSASLCNLLGACLLDTGDASAAGELFEKATRLEPETADGWTNLSVALNVLGETTRARDCAERAASLQPDSSAALAALAGAQMEQGDLDGAIKVYEQAIGLLAPSTQTYCAYGKALLKAGYFDDALGKLELAVETDGNNPIARWMLTMAQCTPMFGSVEEVGRARARFAAYLDELKAWFETAPRPEAHTAVGSYQPFYLAYQPVNNRELLSRYGNLCGQWMQTLPQDAPAPAPRKVAAGGGMRKLRIGIATSHVRDHSVWNAITKGWIQLLDAQRFEIHLFKLGRTEDAQTAFARQQVPYFVEGPSEAGAWARLIRGAHLDVLIYPEIGMDPVTAQLASLRLAPVQACAWGHPETSGLPAMDWYLSAAAFEPANAQNNYTERLVCLPNLGVFVEPLSPPHAAPDLAALGIACDEPLLLCAGSAFKYSPLHDRVWARIAKGLRAKKGGRLVFFLRRTHPTDQVLEARLRRAFAAERVDFDRRAHVVPPLDRAQFFALLRHAALLLDTLGFSGFNTALQAVECGLPVLAREGEFMRGRLASGIMRRINLPELVAATDDAFVETAIRLAEDGAARARLRSQIAARTALLFQDVEPVRALETLLQESAAGP